MIFLIVYHYAIHFITNHLLDLINLSNVLISYNYLLYSFLFITFIIYNHLFNIYKIGGMDSS
jgi:hypothetical protein